MRRAHSSYAITTSTVFFGLLFASPVTHADLPATNTVVFDVLDERNQAPGSGSIPFGNGEAVDLFNGNLLVTHPSSPGIPLGTNHGIALSRSYNSQDARYYDVKWSDNSAKRLSSGQSWVGFGWTSHLGKLFWRSEYKDLGGGNWTYSSNPKYYEFPSGSFFRSYPYPNSAAQITIAPRLVPVEPEDCINEASWCDNKPPGFALCDEGPVIFCPEILTGYQVKFPDGSIHFLEEIVPVELVDARWVKNHDSAGFYTKTITDVYGRTIHVEYWGEIDASLPYPEAIKRIWSEADPSNDIETTLWQSTDDQEPGYVAAAVGMLKTVSAEGFGGNPNVSSDDVVYRFFYEEATVQDDLAPNQEVTVALLKRVELPEVDGTSVGAIEYGYGLGLSLETGAPDYGPLLDRITYPAGAIVEYKHGTWTSGNRLDGTSTIPRTQLGVVKRRVYPDGGGGPSSHYSWEFEREFSLADCAEEAESEAVRDYYVTLPDGRETKYKMRGHPCNDLANDWGATATVVQTTVYDGDRTDAALRTTSTAWEYEVVNGEKIKPLRLSQTTTFHDDVGTCFGETDGGSARTMTTTNYNLNDWGQWRMTEITGDYLRVNQAYRTYTNYNSPDHENNTTLASKHIVGAFDWRFTEYDNQRVEEEFVFDDYGNIQSIIRRERKAAASVTDPEAEPFSKNPAVIGDDVVITRTYDPNTGELLTETLSGGGDYPDGTPTPAYTTSMTFEHGVLKTLTPASTVPPQVPYLVQDNTIDASGLVTSSRDPNGLQTAFDYDSLGRPTRVTPPSSTAHPTRFIYPSLTETRVIVSPGIEEAHVPGNDDQLYSAETTDGLGRVTRRVKAQPDGSTAVQVVRYDQLGRVVFVSEWMDESDYDTGVISTTSWTSGDIDGDQTNDYTISGIPLNGTPARPWGTITYYGTGAGSNDNPLGGPDGLGRVVSMVQADGASRDYAYCGPHVSMSVGGINAVGSETTSETVLFYDGLGRLAVVQAPDGGVDAFYQYDLNGNLKGVEVASSSRGFDDWLRGVGIDGPYPTLDRTFAYNALGQLIQKSEPETGTTQFKGYDAAGNLLTWVDQIGDDRGYHFRNLYDALGRPIQVDRVKGTPSNPDLADVDRLGANGEFESAADLSVNPVANVWTEGTIPAGVFVPGNSMWKQVTYGGCNPAPPGGTNTGGLYLGNSCTYSNTPAESQAVRYALNDVTRDDIVTLKYWRQHRAGTGNRDKLTVFVVPQAAGYDVGEPRYLLQLDESQAPLATWRQMPAMRIGDLFSKSGSEWPEVPPGVLPTMDLYLYIVFKKGDILKTVLGAGVMIDDVFVGRKGVEPLVSYEYDSDVCNGGGGGEACLGGELAANAYLGNLSTIDSYQGGSLVSTRKMAYKGLNGAVSGVQDRIDWSGAGSASTFVTRLGYNQFGLAGTFVAPYQPGVDSAREYLATFKRGALDGLRENGGVTFLSTNGSPPSLEYSAAGTINTIRFANGARQVFLQDEMYRPDAISVLSSEQTLIWDSGLYDYDGAGNIKSIGNAPADQTFKYDLVGRLKEARVLEQATDPGTQSGYKSTYTYSPSGTMSSRTWEDEADPQAVPPLAYESTFNPSQVTDANGNMTRLLGETGADASAMWDPLNRLTAYYTGQPDDTAHPGAHAVAERYLYDAAGYRVVRIPDDPTSGDGMPVISIRDLAGRVVSEFVIDPATRLPTLRKDFVYGAGRLLVEREVTTEIPELLANSLLYVPGGYAFVLGSGTSASSYTLDIRTDSGYVKHLTGVVPTNGKFLIPESDLSLDEVNYIRIRAEQGAPYYSAPVTLAIDSSVDGQSPNQTRAISVSRNGNDVDVRFTLFSANGEGTDIYFVREDTGQQILQTSPPLPAGVKAFTVDDQSLAVPCGQLLTQQAQTMSIGTDVPPATTIQDISAAGATCDEDPTPPDYAFADTYHHRDHLGNLRVTTGSGGEKLQTYDFYPFGMLMASGETESGEQGSRHRFTEHERDYLTGVDYMRARYKPAPAASFMSPDSYYDVSLANPTSWNKYSYVGNNPMNYTDPSGRRMNLLTCAEKGIQDCSVIGHFIYFFVHAYFQDDDGDFFYGEDEFASDYFLYPNPLIVSYDSRSIENGASRTRNSRKCSPKPWVPPPRPGSTSSEGEALVNANIETTLGIQRSNKFSVADQMWRQLVGGKWNYKSQYDERTSPQSFAFARHFANFNAGATGGILRPNRWEFLSLVGLKSQLDNGFGTGEGIPFLVFPFGDLNDNNTAYFVSAGHDYSVWYMCAHGRP